MLSSSHLLCCEALPEERSAGNPHATFCGNRWQATATDDPVRERVTAPDDPVGVAYGLPPTRYHLTEKSSYNQLKQNGGRFRSRVLIPGDPAAKILRLMTS